MENAIIFKWLKSCKENFIDIYSSEYDKKIYIYI